MRATKLYERNGVRRLMFTGVAVGISAAYITAGGALIAAMQSTGDREFNSSFPQASAVIEARKPKSPDAPLNGYTQADVDKVAQIPGVSSVSGFGRGEASMMKTNTVPYLGNTIAYVNDPSMPSATKLSSGSPPRASDQVTLDEFTADHIGVSAGQQLLLKGWRGKVKPFTVTGLTVDGGTPVAGSAALVGMSTSAFLWSSGPNSLTTLLVDSAPAANQPKIDSALAADSHSGSVIGYDQWAAQQAKQAASVAADMTPFLVITSIVVILVASTAVSTTLRCSLASRMRETGLLRAIGASGRHLRAILIRQALIIGAIASASGVALGYGAVAVANLVMQVSGGVGAMSILQPPWGFAVAGLVVGMIVTLLGVMRPAIEAARTSPVEAVVDAETSDTDLPGVKSKRTATSIVLFAIGMLCLLAAMFPPLVILAPVGGIFLCMSLSRSAARIMNAVSRLMPRWKGSTIGLASDSVQRLPLRSGKLVSLVGSSSALIATILLLLATILQIQPLDTPIEKLAMVVAPPSQSQAVEQAVTNASPSFEVMPSGNSGVSLVRSTAVDSADDSFGLAQEVDLAVHDIPGATAMRAGEAIQFQPEGQGGTLDSVLTLLTLMVGGTLILTAVAFASASVTSLTARAGELGVLRAIGMTRRRMIRMLTLEGALVGFVGAFGGALIALGVVTCATASVRFGYGALGWGMLGALLLTATLVAAVATFIPAWLRNRSTVMPASGVE